MVKKLLTLLLLSVSLCGAVPMAHAISSADKDTVDSATNILNSITPDNAPKNPLGLNQETIAEQGDIVPLIKTIISMVTGFIASLAGIYAVFMLLKNAGALITSDGDQKKIGDARNGIFRSLIGVIAIMMSYLIIYSIVDTLFKIGSGTGL
ncbi:hypothetical protein COW46_03560 [Candidatus Gracilibacteria bacterium CG17_big_fil_post_rev_8_21_14_2_50_48_13]|nr:MAG: hypothetical protein COW46_03560 [Candidatus Gracilibacteria bacterium CG17_big_fil_post_rev_8_21_14_2_50_48_13]